MLTQKQIFERAVAALRQGNERSLCAFARTFGRDNALQRLDAIQIRGDFDQRGLTFNGYDYASQKWLGTGA